MNGHRGGAQALSWIVALSVGVSIMSELTQSTPQVVAEEQAVAKAPVNPWLGASFPLENFSRYTSPFGYRQHPMGGNRFHYGLDLAAPMGSYIRSWWAGKVVEVHDHTACGTAAIIQSGLWTHVYCHMQGSIVVEKEGGRVLVDRDGGIEIRQGQMVTSGQRIGRVGMTGSTTGPHLHWGLKYEGAWVDPAMVIRAEADYQQLQATQAVD
ncbi:MULTISPECIES: M23 family metallopeptidase [Cyanophyceae]|uniref:M23 family metallopeptidase n=1 Tax=Cyanophyceae TaxID=3028117 RepID=UPI001688E500|nr:MULTISPECIES: M23 family metallopeptidase [Cyanophyceae]MBD1916759.1 M23 family metallopeptidase [Phormidium sp. FACHB-77]MBD2029389.1 M23 family metallopeptidase [Phormidium sp. FACHB-322]MBD2051964.1 M23 family metallopeptidase [Leptolyngbya sp. FACHB-60]